jgi:hypothetical protein
VVSLGGLHMSTHTPGKHPMCHTSRLQHDDLESHLNLNLLIAQRKGANKSGTTADSSGVKAKSVKAGSRLTFEVQHLCAWREVNH